MVEPSTTLVVIGSRSLDLSPSAKAWAVAGIKALFAEVQPDRLVTGDADGPDAWSRAEAVRRLVPFFCYARTGEILGKDGKLLGHWTGERPPSPGSDRAAWRDWFLGRDDVLARHACIRAAQRRDLTVVQAFVDKGSETRGTEYTVSRFALYGASLPSVVVRDTLYWPIL